MDKTHMSNNTVLIDIKELDERPGPFCMSFRFDLKKIMSSIESVGLINKPDIRRNRAGSTDIITGYRRILALKALDWDRVSCMDLTDAGLTDKDLLLLNIYDNLFTRGFNYIEKGMILNLLLTYITRDEIYETYMDILDISSRRDVDILIKTQGLNDAQKEIIAVESLSIKTIESLLDLEETSRCTILKWITDLKLNINQQALFIEYINDISIRDGIEIQELLQETTFSNLMMEPGENHPQKAKRFIDILRTMRMPVLTKNEKAFNRQISNLKLPKGVRITHSPFFEGADYLLEVSFKDGKELKDKIDKLESIKDLSIIKDPWKE